MRLDPKLLFGYFTRYFKEYRKYLDEKYPSRKNEFTLYKDYPYEINVYTDEKATRVFADYGKAFKVNVIEVGKVLGPSEGNGKLLHMISNRYLSRILDKPETMAQLDVMSVFEHEEMMEEESLREMEEAEKYYEEEMDQQIKRWFEIIEKTKEVEKATLEKREKEVQATILIAANQYSSFEIYEKIGHALFMASMDLSDTLNSSIFLTVNGKYRAAMALLRRWLETVCMGVYYDAMLKTASATEKNSLFEEVQAWLARPKYHRFTGEGGIISKLIDNDTESKGSQILKVRPKTTQSSFRKYIEEQYSELSKYIHSGGTTVFEDVIFFAEFDDALFIEWFNRFMEINTICGILIVLKFPEIMKFYNESELNGFPLLDADIIARLQKLA